MIERILYPPIISYLEECGYTTFREVPVGRWFPKRVDVIGVNSDLTRIVSVEVKVKDFRRALNQTLFRLYFSDYVYAAFPKQYAEYVLRKYEESLEKEGIGLLAVDHSVEVLLPPRVSKLVIKSLKEHVLKVLREIGTKTF